MSLNREIQNMRTSFKAADTKLLGSLCVTTKGSPEDLTIYGQKGFIYQHSDNAYMVVKYMANGDEVGKLMNERKAKEWVKRLDVPRLVRSQVVLANS